MVLFWTRTDSTTAQFRIYRNTVPSVPTTQFYRIAEIPANITNYTDLNVVNRTTYWYVVTAVDAAGNESGPSNIASATPLPDITPPETTITSAPPAISSNASATFAFQSNESGSTFQCQLDGSGFVGCTSPQVYTGLSDGNHTFFVRAIDPSGNVDATPATHNWAIDTVAPDTLVTGGPPALTNQTVASFNLQSNESPVTFECSLDGSPFSTCPSTANYTHLAEGHHTFRARARDLAGNVDPTPGSYTWRIDTTPPALTLTQHPPAFTSQTTAVFDWTSSETTYECSLDGAPFSSCPGKPAIYTNLSEATHHFRVRGVDDAGNVGSPAGHNWIVDLTPPVITNLQGPPPFTASTTANFSWTVNDNLSGVAGVECQTLNSDSTFRPCTTQTTDVVIGLASGAHTWHIRARDNAGNESDPLDWNWYVDVTGPGVTVLSPDGGENWAVGSSKTITWRAADLVQSGLGTQDVFYSTDGGTTWMPIPGCLGLSPSISSCNWDIPDSVTVVTVLARVKVEARDNVGNVGSDTSNANFTLSDQTPPVVSVTAPTAGEIVLSITPYLIQWSSADNLGLARHHLYLSLDGGLSFAPIPECTNLPGSSQSCSWDPPDVNNGTAVVRVCAVDITTIPPAPNTTCAQSPVFTIAFDTMPPDTTITGGPAEGSFTGDNTPEFAFDGFDPPPNPSGIASFECRIDGGSFLPCISPYTTPPLGEGLHTFEVRSIDVAGNVDGSPATRNFQVDTMPPTVSVSSPVGGEMIQAGSTFVIAWTASDGSGSGLAGFSVDYSTDGGTVWNPADGCTNLPPTATSCVWTVPAGGDTAQGRVRVSATDAVANTGTGTSPDNFYIDNTPPTAQVDSGPPAVTSATNATFSFSGTDNFTPSGSLAFQCQLDSGGYEPCTSPKAYTGLANGPHQFNVVAIDLAGWTGLPANYDWIVDLTPPDTQITSAPPVFTNNQDATFEFTGTDDVTPPANLTFECQIDGGGFSPCVSPFSATGLAEANHAFEVRAMDETGNLDATPATHTWTVDLTPPDTQITSGPPVFTTSSTATFQFTGADNFSTPANLTFECSLDAGPYEPCTSPKTYTGLGLGPHTFNVRATDQSGNTDATPAVYNWTIVPLLSYPFFDDFESGLGNWTTGNFGSGQDWHLVTCGPTPPTAPTTLFSGEGNCTNYSNNKNAVVYTHPIDLTSATNPWLSFYRYYDVERRSTTFDNNYDEVEVYVCVEGVDNCATANAGTMVTGLSGLYQAWRETRIPLHQWIGQQVRIKFRMRSDGSVNRPGFHLDNVSLSEGAPQPSNYPLNDNFEAGMTNWTADVLSGATSVGDPFHLVTCDSNSPSNSMFSGEGACTNYRDDKHTYVVSRPISLTSAVTPGLSYWVKHALQSSDDIRVYICVQDTHQCFAPSAGVLVRTISGNSVGWVRYRESLSAYLGQIIRVKFRFTTTTSTNALGFFVDDISVDEVTTLNVTVTGGGTVTSSPAGINCPGDCTEIYDTGTNVTLTATPDVDFQFENWSGDCSGNNPVITITMDTSKTCTANFSPLPPGGGVYPYNEDFETGTDGWYFKKLGSAGDDWHLVTCAPTPPSPTNVLFSGEGACSNYADNKHALAITDRIDLSSATHPYLTLQHYYNLQERGGSGLNAFNNNFDFVEIYVCVIGVHSCGSATDGILIAELSGIWAKWQQLQIYLGDFVGETIRIKFRMFSDGSTQRLGMYLDDISVADGPAPETPVYPFSDDFEGTMDKWRTIVFSGASSTADPWHIVGCSSPPPPNTPPNAIFSGEGSCSNYANSKHAIVISDPIDLSFATAPTLTFHQRYYLETNYDYVRVYVCVEFFDRCEVPNEGDLLATFNGNASTSWGFSSFDLSPYVGEIIRIKFRMASDASVNYAGFYGDDVSVSG
ncbi:MAG: choice-of-anchor J domain-containing protein [bacterium JZ-2024 1]